MNIPILRQIQAIPDRLLSSIESRDVVLWIRHSPSDPESQAQLASIVGLPWKMVFIEEYDPRLVDALVNRAAFEDPMTMKRGFIQIIDSDPSRIELPQRSLPIYLLNGRSSTPTSDFNSRLRRMTMLEQLRRSSATDILILADTVDPLPSDLLELWASGFRAFLTVASDLDDADIQLKRLLEAGNVPSGATHLKLPSESLIHELLAGYEATYPADRKIIRIRDRDDNYLKLDVTELDEPERPILNNYSLIEERDLTLLSTEELSEDDFMGFFQNPESSWRPYAAGLPWIRDKDCRHNLGLHLKRLDTQGADENVVAYIASESGAGGTTLARMLAWEQARNGYPVLLARSIPFVFDALPVVNYLNRVHNEAELQSLRSAETASSRYETPWIIVFDSLHSEGRESELLRFRNELAKSGRPVCLLIVTGSTSDSYLTPPSAFKKICELNHAIDASQAQLLGRHLNQFLQVYGKPRHDWQWERFYQEHTVRYIDGIAAFWVTLSFWIQGQYDLSESIQEWMYKCFKSITNDRLLQDAILEIAALSSERMPMPEVLLPETMGSWPVSYSLQDQRSSLAPLGLVCISSDGMRHWALVHDILGRFLINALFYDYSAREGMGLEEARDSDHLRFLILRRISQRRLLGERLYRAFGEEFAASIFKVDPDHGHGSFTSLWHEVLTALNAMPVTLRDTSRVFRHHTAISRRRIAKLDGRVYSIDNDHKRRLLQEAIQDIEYALRYIKYTPGSESDLNLYNSLANAYFDLSEIESQCGASRERISRLRMLAGEATRKAYEESPSNSFVIETYVKNLLHTARDDDDRSIECCIQALGILFSALSSTEGAYRASQLGDLADHALKILFQQASVRPEQQEPATPSDVLVRAWQCLASGSERGIGNDLAKVPVSNRRSALEMLSHPVGRGNMQIIRLAYDLISIDQPYAFKQQLQLVEQLQAKHFRAVPQLRLEYAILLYQNSRAIEGDKVFRSLRMLWKDSEHFVQVPDRLRWLRSADGKSLQSVHAVIGSDVGSRPMARVREFGLTLVPFRPEEHGLRRATPGAMFACHVSFGHNGPFLRPVTAHSGQD